MATASALAPWASDVREHNGLLQVGLRRGLAVEGVLEMLRKRDLSNVKAVRVPGTVGLAGLRALLSDGAVANLASLALQGFEDADDAVDVVFGSPVAAQLRVLKVWSVSDTIDARLARGEVPALRQLDIRNSPALTSLDRFFASRWVASLRHLTVNRTGLSDATELFGNPAVTGLRSLSLAACEFDSETVEHLVRCRNLPSLRKLNLSHNPQDDVFTSIYDLLRARALQSLESLALCGTDLEDFDWDRVVFKELRRLDLRDNPLDLDEVLEVLQSPGLPKLEQLVVHAPEEFVPSDLDSRLIIDDRTPRWS